MTARDVATTLVVFTYEHGPLANLERVAELARGHVLLVLCDASTSPARLARNRTRCDAAGARHVVCAGASLAAQRNAAVRACETEGIVFLDDDCFPSDGWLERLARGLAAGPEVVTCRIRTPPGLVDAHQRYFDQDHGPRTTLFTRNDLRVFPSVRAWLRPHAGGRGIAPWAVGTGSSFAMRRETVLRLGGFREDLGVGTPARSGEDVDLFFRVLHAGGTILYDAEAVVWHHHVRRGASDYLRTAYGYGLGGREMLCRNLRAKPAYAVVLGARPFQLALVALAHAARGDASTARMCLSSLRGWVGLPLRAPRG